MSEKYQGWIKKNVKGDGYAKCIEITLAMGKEFPELQRRKGFFHDGIWGRRTHWWLRDENGNIIDPTAKQHPTGEWFPVTDRYYTDLTDLNDEELSKVVPSGPCANCGGDVYGGGTVCSDICHNEFARSIMGELP